MSEHGGTLIAPMLVYATRYALGRRSGAAMDVRNAIKAHADALRRDAGCREAIIRDIAEAADYGDACDRDAWMDALDFVRGLA